MRSPLAGLTLPDWSGATITPATCETVVVTVFEVTGLWVLPRLSWNEMEPLLLMITPAATPVLTVTVNCRDPEPPAATVPTLQLTRLPLRVPPPVALTKLAFEGTKSERDTFVADTVPLLVYVSV